ncbi:MAG: hypothetical protein H6581_26545 [Bacteroidia bacterium]|nr:hypothetical protein [Bacteroidia bacterium]
MKSTDLSRENEIFRGEFGKPGLLNWLGIVICAAGIILLVTGAILVHAEVHGAVLALLAILALGGGWLFWAGLRGKGKFVLYPRKLVWSKGGQPEQEVLLEKLDEFNFHPRHLFVRPKYSREKLIFPRVTPARGVGMIWLAWTYRDQFPAEIWAPEAAASKWEPHEVRWNVKREFVAESGHFAFFDPGMVVNLGEYSWFFPLEDLGALPKVSRAGGMKVSLIETLPHFEPNPSHLPLESVLRRIFHAQIPDSQKIELIENLAGYHGGCSPQAEEFLGMKVNFSEE